MGLAALKPKTSPRIRTIAALSPAKINLCLEVLGVRGDGYHDIHSLAIGVGLYDRLTFHYPNPMGLSVNSSDPTLHTESNLAARAALLVARRAGCDPQVHVEMEKRIPLGAGLGGGSSDAATSMKACNDLWRAGLSISDLARLAAELGSDVPLFFHLPVVEMAGRGESVATVELAWRGFVLLIFPGVHVSTADVYKAWRKDDCQISGPISYDSFRSLTRAEDLHDRMENHLEQAVYRVCPRVKEVQDALVSLGLHRVRVTGSGSAMFRLFDEEDQARHAAGSIQRNLPGLSVDLVAAPVGAPALSLKEN